MPILIIIFVIVVLQLSMKIEFHLYKNRELFKIRKTIYQEELLSKIIMVLKLQCEPTALIQEKVNLSPEFIDKILKFAYLNDALSVYEMISSEYYQKLSADLIIIKIKMEKKYKIMGLIIVLLMGLFYLFN